MLDAADGYNGVAIIMNKFIFTVETEAFEGVKRIAQKIALDFEKVYGVLPLINDCLPSDGDCKYSIIFATLGKSQITEKLINEGRIDPSAIKGKREVYQIKFISDIKCDGTSCAAGAKKTLLVLGSDKRGTIYGMFALSEYIGVSPLHFWGDAEPARNDKIEITENIETVSKEPSVKYRGFFINDEWPCFGNWTSGHFGGFNAKMYEHVFELLLRLKGNYLWPAMWSSSFALDGPGNLSEELADIYGIVIGASHHEPCLRASEEWGRVKGSESEYGNEWNYYTNKKGLLKYWEDGLKRSGKYEKIITIGMRGERDSSMLGRDSSLKDNIDLLKDIIKNQRELIKKHVNSDVEKVPQLLALYKEVEEYFYGNEQTEGLKDWNEIENVICMLCEDNFGFMRTLPTKETRDRKGGFGMYYHFDYHGAPISYEWVASASFERTWEQMCMAYDYGVKDIWIVNVGDLKFNEVPLSYFMELAYDFDKWGTSNINSIDAYTSMWLDKTFPAAGKSIKEKMSYVLHRYIKMNSLRRPEALNADIYHPCNYLEADRMLEFAQKIDDVNEEIFSAKDDPAQPEKRALSENEKGAYYSMIYWPAKASVNLLRMHLYAGKNRHFANQNKKIANDYAALVTECINKDSALSEDFAKFKNGKWKGMELAQHVGFTKWNEDNCRFPQRIQIEPANKPRMVVSRKDKENVYTKTYGNPMTVEVDDFLYAGNDEVIIEIANDGIGSFNYVIEPDASHDWLEISSLKGAVESQEEIILRVKRENLTEQIKTARLLIKDGETAVAIEIKAKNVNVKELPSMTFLENNGVITINANHFCGKKDVSSCGFIELKNYGKNIPSRVKNAASSVSTNSGAMKVFPTTSSFSEKDEKPSLEYRFLIEEAGDYITEIWTTPTNSIQKNCPLRFQLTNKNEKQLITSVPLDFRAGDYYDGRWNESVLNNIRVNRISLTLEKGVQEISISALEAGLVLEKILIYRKNCKPLQSYLGPPESFYTSANN